MLIHIDLKGLEYFHRTLQVIHGLLDCTNVLLGHDGAVKLGKLGFLQMAHSLIAVANTGGSLLRGERATVDTERIDIRALGLVMTEMMEPTTVLETPGSLILKQPEKWDNAQGIMEFLNDKRKTLRELLSHPFLCHDSSYSCLMPQVLIAQVSARRTWEVFS